MLWLTNVIPEQIIFVNRGITVLANELSLSLSISLSLSLLILHPASVATASLFISSTWTARTAFYLYEKHSVCSQYIHSCNHCERFWNGQITRGGARAARPFIARILLPILPLTTTTNGWLLMATYFFVFAPNLMLIWAGNVILNAMLLI